MVSFCSKALWGKGKIKAEMCVYTHRDAAQEFIPAAESRAVCMFGGV